MPDASSVDRLRRTLLLTAPVALSAVLLGACSRTQLSAFEIAPLLDHSLAAADRAAFAARFSAQPGPQALAARVYANLATPGGSTADPVARVLPGGHDRVQVSWNYPGEPTVISVADMGIVDGLVTNLSQASTATEWLAEPALVRSTDRLVVAAADDAALARWWSAADTGLAALERVAPGSLRMATPLVVVSPVDLLAFARYAGTGADRTAAVTVVPGLASSQGFRVVVNPMAADDPKADAATITHEAVHAAMGSPRLTGTPGWLLEGIAEAVTGTAHRTVAAGNAGLARAAVAHALPRVLPDPESGEPASYALAQVAVDAAVTHVGWTAVLDEAERRSRGGGRLTDRQILGWYRAALARLR